MTVAVPPSGWERREAIMLRVVPYCALAVSVILVPFDGSLPAARMLAIMGVALVAVAWLLLTTRIGPA